MEDQVDVSWDRERLLEALDAFRGGVGDAPLLRKWNETGPSQGEPGPAQRISFVLSTDEVDRHGDVISADGWNLESYRNNPVCCTERAASGDTPMEMSKPSSKTVTRVPKAWSTQRWSSVPAVCNREEILLRKASTVSRAAFDFSNVSRVARCLRFHHRGTFFRLLAKRDSARMPRQTARPEASCSPVRFPLRPPSVGASGPPPWCPLRSALQQCLRFAGVRVPP